jgi:hypothetical protein
MSEKDPYYYYVVKKGKKIYVRAEMKLILKHGKKEKVKKIKAFCIREARLMARDLFVRGNKYGMNYYNEITSEDKR